MSKITMQQLYSLCSSAADKVSPTARRELRRLAIVGQGLMKSTIQQMHAVDTGTMLNSTTVSYSGDTALIGPTVSYAVYVAQGTSRMRARPFHEVSARKLAQRVSEFGFTADVLGL